jgi:hypothetical protein
MNDQIFETVVTTVDLQGTPHVAPMGVRYRSTTPADAAAEGGWTTSEVVLMPFKPSTTLDNISATGHAVLNLVTDTRVFAGCVTGRRDFVTHPAERITGVWLAGAAGHVELKLAQHDDDAQRPVLRFERVHQVQHAPFIGFNRAQAAVIEGAVLVSRLRMLPRAKLEQEMAYLQIAIDKTAGAAEHEAWGWLREAVDRHLGAAPASASPEGPR